MTIQVMASHIIIILTTLEVSLVLLENIYSTVVTYDHTYDCQNFFTVQALFPFTLKMFLTSKSVLS